MIYNKSGSIVNVSSIWGVEGASCEAHYSATKAAVISLTKSLAKEYGPSNIRVNAVAPGVINTKMNAHLSENDMEELREETPLGRIGTPQEAAEAIYFLASEQASFITGQVLVADGGFI
jgi:3-oxoacyl-[acyl-carrier protein] reductase